MTTPTEGKLMKRPERRRALIAAAARAFARSGYAATNLEDVAAEAGVSRVLIYRHFESKAELYEAVLADVSDKLRDATGHPNHTPASLDALVAVAQEIPDGFRLFFRQSAQEPEFRRHADELRAAMTATAEPLLREVIHDEDRLQWAAQLIPTIAVEGVIAWLDAGKPSPATAAETITNLIGAAVRTIASAPPED
ncbi:TetR family transcriptional regulator [Kribbella sp. VKM Ac-2527]|uniref:TetR family transcriptional regulator n=1 Tax=Kribbella caucasensis TaxID=2512215 RepID=A0A4R6JH59_9ACTN|nr:TetR/AcrR family transcriptional regulator [Kribbella sp. VKM Ac-2527]TDO33966.1 TetR family transcriptional regulator [Kribbella sp. VKM Ac-2527]